MKIALSPRYRTWMFVLLPTTLGLGTAGLWVRSLRWPCSVDAGGLTLRYRGQIPWNQVRKIGVWRDYCDGHVSRLEIHRQRGVCRIPVGALRDGDRVAETILALFKAARLEDAQLRKARLEESRPKESGINESTVKESWLMDARLRESWLREARLMEARLKEAQRARRLPARAYAGRA